MNQISLKSGMSTLFLFSFILLCSLLTSENAYSQRRWSRDDMFVTYKRDKSVILDFLFYDYGSGPIDQIPHIKECKILYSVDGKNYDFLIHAVTYKQVDDPMRCMTMKSKKTGHRVQFLNCQIPIEEGYFWPNHDNNVKFKVGVSDIGAWKGDVFSRYKAYEIRLKWFLPNTNVKYVKIKGAWGNSSFNQNFEEVYTIDSFKPKSEIMKKAASELNSEAGNVLKICSLTDAVSVTGAKRGDKIHVYNTLGSKVKTIVAKDDVVNIPLMKNQVYSVKVGKKIYKIAL